MHDDHDHDHDDNASVGDGAAQATGSPWLDRVNEAYYDRLGDLAGRRTRERINWMCAQCDGRSVLDIGCSQGIASILLGREGFQVLGIDITSEAIDFAMRELAIEPVEVRARVDFKRLDLLSMMVAEGYDNVVLGEVIEHQTSAPRFIKAAAKHVAPGGRMIVTVPFGLHPFPDHKCTVFPRDVIDALGDAFEYPTIEVSGGYVRVVARKTGPSTSGVLDRNRLFDATEAETQQIQSRYFEILHKSRALQKTKQEQAERLKALHEKHGKLTLDTERTLSKSREEMAQLKSQLLLLRNESLKASDELAMLNRRATEWQVQADKAAAATRLVPSLEKKIAQIADYRRRLEHQHETVKSWLLDANQELVFLKGSVSFRLGMALVSALRSPRDFVALPIRLGRLFFGGLRRRATRRSMPRAMSDAKEGDPETEQWRRLGNSAVDRSDDGKESAPEKMDIATVTPVELTTARGGTMLPRAETEQAVAVPRQPFPERIAELRVAAIMDDFTREAFRHACQLRQLTPENWQAELVGFRPHIVLVESAWRGEEDRWARKIYPLSKELAELVAWARNEGIPTAFWNKEDPVHFSVFLQTARLFDHVFTTDIDCVKSYRVELGHDRVHLLPFACEPRTHNPMEAYARRDAFCFAGSYYAKYPERQRDFASLVDALREARPVDIFDRNHGKDEPSLVFPDEYVPLIRGNLPYDQIDRAYKGYRYGININTVKQSQSMFARRAFDLLASNTVTVSNFSRGLRLMFGDLIVSTDSGSEASKCLVPLLEDDGAYRKYRLQGLRKVLSEHTYEDRLGFVVEKISGRSCAPMLPQVVVVAAASDRMSCMRTLAAYDRQVYSRKRLVLVSDDIAVMRDAPRSDVEVLNTESAVGLDVSLAFADAFVACFSGDDYYGPHYLTDLALATRYSGAQAIGKPAHHCGREDGGTTLHGNGTQYSRVEALPLRASIVAASCLSGRTLDSFVGDCIDQDIVGLESLAIDEFNYCRQWTHDSCPAVDDPVLNSGIKLAQLQAMAEIGGDEDEGAGSDAMFLGFGTKELSILFQPGDYADGRVHVAVSDDGIEIASKLGDDKYTYVYADKLIAIDTLFPDEIGRFNMLVSSEMLLSLTLIFLDAEQRRIGHIIRACNSNQSVMPLAGTRYVMLGVRIQGAGLATLRQLVLQHVPPAIDALVGTSKHLLVSRSYPGYDNLYNYTFVHRRALGYREEGMHVDVFRFSDAPLAYEEFEGVDIASGNVGDLSLMLRSNAYESILVHSFDEQTWSAVQACLQHTRVIVWVHGAEIQPWYRRDFNFSEDGDRRRGIQRSDMRMGLWRQVLMNMSPNLHLVFVSEFLAREAMRDLDIEIPSHQYSVIHNIVDGELFNYVEKPQEQRHRILSIRPYTKPTYANDLAVKAILDLAGEPWFDELHIRLIGDGAIFEETVAPLRNGFPNVIIEKRFLTQRQIVDLHKEYGVFLVPSRIDSQGVSRDEAMASGLVPVTNRVSAIPEFVDDDVAFLAPPESWRGLADAIRKLHADPEAFLRMSRAAAARARDQSGRLQTLTREIALIREGSSQSAIRTSPMEPTPRRIAVYADLNLNLVDGSSVWVASLAEVLAGLPDIQLDLFLKHRLRNTRVLGPALALNNVRLIEPDRIGDSAALAPDEAISRIVAMDLRHRYDAVVLRGFKLSSTAAKETALSGRLWTYLTDIPQDPSLLDANWRAALGEIAEAAMYVLCQTAALERLVFENIPESAGKTRLLPPMVPAMRQPSSGNREPRDEAVLRIVYAGKFAPLWGIREMFEVAEKLAASGVYFEWHVYGDKIHDPADDPSFKDEVLHRLEVTPGMIWHRGTPRAALIEAMSTMHVGWAWRLPALEDSTLELSTKVLEYGLAGIPALMAPSAANIAAFGSDYPLYVSNADQAVERLAALAADDDLLSTMRTRMLGVADAYTFARIREDYVSELLPAPRAVHDLSGSA
jgi:glycosyltransferase involved in cell wall biosynthesis/spore maturation protein CgeB/SAM-dependent methyltransferase